YYFDGDNGETVREEEIPADMVDEAEEKREEMLEEICMFDDDLMHKHLEGEELDMDAMQAAIRTGVLSLELVPVFMGSAYKNKGVQLLLNAVERYLPSPLDIENTGSLQKTGEPVVIPSDPTAPVVMYAFKLTEDKYGQLTYVRIYQGELHKGQEVENMRTGKKLKIGRLVRMHSDEMES
ncbi:MAG: elongation factor G, partial [bacterium]|nr:elongation factor G [bacterium]